jgi:hypothetical protein
VRGLGAGDRMSGSECPPEGHSPRSHHRWWSFGSEGLDSSSKCSRRANSRVRSSTRAPPACNDWHARCISAVSRSNCGCFPSIASLISSLIDSAGGCPRHSPRTTMEVV